MGDWWMSIPIDPLKAIQDAWFKRLIDFRSWYMPETSQTAEWKSRQVGNAIKSCPSRLMDDSESMLVEYRKSQNAPVAGGATAFMPIMLTATAMVDQPPNTSQLLSVPYFTEVLINDELVKIRLIPKTVRAQIAFYATNAHDARSVCDQVCAYFSDELKRRFEVAFAVGGTTKVPMNFTVFDNELFPSPVPSEAINLSIFTVDVQLIGYVPQVLGLGNPFETTTGNGYNPDGSAVDQPPVNDLVVIQADQFDTEHLRVLADRETGDITVEKIVD